MLALPSLERAVEYLESCNDPAVTLRLTLLRNPRADVASLRGQVASMPNVRAAFEIQRPDGSWGDHDRAANRVLPTLWTVKTLGEMGLAEGHEGWEKAVDFLVAHGHTDEGVFAINGSRDGVLSCYVGLAAIVYLSGGLRTLAHPQLEWIRRHQEVRVAGEERRDDPLEEWSPHLKTKYGGCMAETSCLVGLLRSGRALASSGCEWAPPLAATIREVFLERRLLYTSGGGIVPLAVSPKKAASWLEPTFPTDWRVDLIELVEFVARTGPGDERMQDAIDKIVEYQLPDGTWPLRRAFSPDYPGGLERPRLRKPSPMITMRVVEAVQPLSME